MVARALTLMAGRDQGKTRATKEMVQPYLIYRHAISLVARALTLMAAEISSEVRCTRMPSRSSGRISCKPLRGDQGHNIGG